jgi:predicted anti-sigma-YlaC factor YlaD
MVAPAVLLLAGMLLPSIIEGLTSIGTSAIQAGGAVASANTVAAALANQRANAKPRSNLNSSYSRPVSKAPSGNSKWAILV